MTLLLTFLFGASCGSFLTMFVPRLHDRKGGMVAGRSACPKCHAKLTVFDLIPVLSYLFLGGNCRHCKKAIPWHYPATELVTGIAFVLIVRYTWTSELGEFAIMHTALLLTYTVILIAVSLYDLRYGEIPDRIMLPAIFVAALVSPFPFEPTPTGALAGALIPLTFFGLLILISKGRWMGGGDIRLGVFMGLILGWQHVLVALGIAYIVGGLVSIALVGSGIKRRTDPVPFGPFLALGAFSALIAGDTLAQWYMMVTGIGT